MTDSVSTWVGFCYKCILDKCLKIIRLHHLASGLLVQVVFCTFSVSVCWSVCVRQVAEKWLSRFRCHLIAPRERAILGVGMGWPIVTNGKFEALLCESA